MAKYQELYHRIAARIISGELKEGTRLPSGAELAERCSVSYITAHKAYELLCRNNLAEARKGQGFFVLRVNTPPSAVSKPLSIGKIGLLLDAGSDDIHGVFYRNLLSRLQLASHAPIALCNSWMMENYSFEDAKQAFQTFAEAGIETLIILGDSHFPYRALEELHDSFRQIIFVLFFSGEKKLTGASYVLLDMKKAGFLASDQLFKSGFRKQLFLTREPVTEEPRRRLGISRKLFDMDMLDGIEESCRENGFDFAESGRIITQNMPCRDNPQKFLRQLEQAFDEGYDGFICMNDLRALAVYQLAAERGLVIGKDIGVTGNFNTPLSASMLPPLSSMDFQVPMLVDGVMEILNGNASGKTIRIEPHFIRRNSEKYEI